MLLFAELKCCQIKKRSKPSLPNIKVQNNLANFTNINHDFEKSPSVKKKPFVWGLHSR